jgi:predicted DNA-binding transcriptional regulator AlpA
MKQTNPQTLPLTGKSRFREFEKFLPFSREKFRQLSKVGLAPKPERMGIRLTFYDNAELHRFLKDPLNYRIQTEESLSEQNG